MPMRRGSSCVPGAILTFHISFNSGNSSAGGPLPSLCTEACLPASGLRRVRPERRPRQSVPARGWAPQCLPLASQPRAVSTHPQAAPHPSPCRSGLCSPTVCPLLAQGRMAVFERSDCHWPCLPTSRALACCLWPSLCAEWASLKPDCQPLAGRARRLLSTRPCMCPCRAPRAAHGGQPSHWAGGWC